MTVPTQMHIHGVQTYTHVNSDRHIYTNMYIQQHTLDSDAELTETASVSAIIIGMIFLKPKSASAKGQSQALFVSFP